MIFLTKFFKPCLCVCLIAEELTTKKKKKLGNLDREKEKPNGLKEIYQRNYEATFVARKLPNSSKAIRLTTHTARYSP